MKTIGYAALAALLFAAAGASAQGTPRKIEIPDLSPAVQDRFSQADTNNSGGLDKVEAATAGFAVEKNFDNIDSDHDHIVTVYEIGTYLAGKGREWASADKNGDGEISRDEASTSPSLANIFTKADRDSDGIVRKEEQEAFSQTTLYQNVDLPYVVPNIINKKF